MEVTQIYEFVNNATKEFLGEEQLLKEDLSNIVDVGTAIFNAGAVDNYVRTLVDHIGKVVFVDRVYKSGAPDVLMDGWEYGSVCEKISGVIPEAEESEDWELQDGASYDQQIFYKPTIEVKFFNGKKVFTIPSSFTQKQVKSSFSNAGQMNGFLSMLRGNIAKSMTVKVDALIYATIRNFIAQTIYSETQGASISGRSGIKAVNLLYLYNQRFGKSLTAAEMYTDKDFDRFATYQMGLYSDRMQIMSSLYNISGKARFTPKDMQHIVLLSEFARGAEVYLQSDTFHNDLTRLPKYESVPMWQGSGTSNDETGKVYCTIEDESGNKHDVTVTGVIGVIFDRDALGVSNLEEQVRTAYNAKGDFYNNYYAFESHYFNDFNENFVVFYGA